MGNIEFDIGPSDDECRGVVWQAILLLIAVVVAIITVSVVAARIAFGETPHEAVFGAFVIAATFLLWIFWTIYKAFR